MSPSSFFLLELFLFFYSCNMFVQKCNLLFCLFYVQGIYKPKFVLKNNHYISLYIFVILMREK